MIREEAVECRLLQNFRSVAETGLEKYVPGNRLIVNLTLMLRREERRGMKA